MQLVVIGTRVTFFLALLRFNLPVPAPGGEYVGDPEKSPTFAKEFDDILRSNW